MMIIAAVKYSLLIIGLVLLTIHICLDLFYYVDRYEQQVYNQQVHHKGRKFKHTKEELSLIDNVLIEPNVCRDPSSPNLLIAIKSQPTDLNQRIAVRLSWLKNVDKVNVDHLFVLGTEPDGSIRKDVLKERRRFGDLIIGDFDEDFYNSTLKSLLTLNWTAIHCPSQWLLYVDDDVIVNIDNVLKFIDSSSSEESKSNIYCQLRSGEELEVDRTQGSSNYLPKKIYKNDTFPSFCRNYGSLFGPNILNKLVETALDHKSGPKLDLDNVFVTGIVAEAAGVPRVAVNFTCCGDYGPREYQQNLVLGKQGRGVMFMKQWQEMITN